MRTITLCVAMILALPGFAATVINETNFPIQYEVMNTMKVGALMVGHFCTMTVRDQANRNVALVIQTRGGGCRLWDAGTVLHGRREKNKIELLTKDDKGKLKVEEWPITATVNVQP